MNSIKELYLSFVESAKDRLKNPMIGAFVIAWIAVNWKSIAILLFSNKKIEEKISFIESNYFDLIHNLWIPLGFAGFYVNVLPYIMVLSDRFTQKAIVERKLISKNQRIADIQNKQEIAAEESQLEKIIQRSPNIELMKEEIAELKSQLDEKTDREESQIDNGEKKKPQKRKSTKITPKTIPWEKTESNSTERRYDSKEYPIMKDIVIRDLAKTEREWILIYALYSSDFGEKALTKEHLRKKYSESNRTTLSRMNNLTNNIRNMVKSSQLKFINDEEMLLTSTGKKDALDVLNR